MDNQLFSLFSLGAKAHAVDIMCRLSWDIYSSEYYNCRNTVTFRNKAITSIIQKAQQHNTLI